MSTRKRDKIGTPLFFLIFKFFCQQHSLDFDADEQIEFTQTEDVEVLNSFDTMGLKEDLLRGIYAYGIFISFFLTLSSS
jgi:hypothetical protein